MYTNNNLNCPLVSIITVVLNGAKYIETAIESVLSQTYKNWEFIIIDGGSTDGTIEILKSRGSNLRYISERDNGIYDAMNKGIRESKGEIIGLLNSDDYLEPNAIERIISAYTGQLGIPAVYYGDTRIIYEDVNIKAVSKASHTRLTKQMSIVHQSMFVHKDLYRIYGAYDLKYKLASDYDFVLRLYKSKIPFIYVGSIIANFRRSSERASEKHFKQSNSEVKKLMQAHLGLRGLCSFYLVNVLGIIRSFLHKMIERWVGKSAWLRFKKLSILIGYRK